MIEFFFIPSLYLHNFFGGVKCWGIKISRKLAEGDSNNLNPINFRATLIFTQYECAKIDSDFFAHLGARKLILCEFLKYHFRPKFDGILQNFSPP